MRWTFVWLLAFLPHVASADDDIVAVLERSQALRLQSLPVACVDSPQAERLRRSFQALLQSAPMPGPVELRLITGPTLAETLHGRIVVVNEALGDLPEAERLFVLAHELGHVALGHWLQMGLLFQKWVPGAVTPAQTDAVQASLSQDASGLAHQQEYEADAFAASTLARLGQTQEAMLAVFGHLGPNRDTPTHPATLKRLQTLRALGLQASVRP